MSEWIGAPLDAVEAQAWAERSLVDGTLIARGIARRLHEFDVARVALPASTGAFVHLDDAALMMSATEIGLVFETMLRRLGRGVNANLVVEDESGRRGDPLVVGDVCFVDDRPLWWTGLAS